MKGLFLILGLGVLGFSCMALGMLALIQAN